METEKINNGLCEFQSFDVLGELRDGRILFWSNVNNRLHSVKIQNLNRNVLMQIGGDEVAEKVTTSSFPGKPGEIAFSDVKKHIVRTSSIHQLGDPQYLGQGLHKAERFIVLLVGGRALLWDGRTLERFCYPWAAGSLVNFEVGREWVDINKVFKIFTTIENDGVIETILAELHEQISQWKFEGDMDALLLAGWYMAQYIQKVWSWRPHLWLTGPPGTGKTLMNEWMWAVGGELALRCEGHTLTEAGLRQAIGCDSRLVAIDDFDKNRDRDKLIFFMRAANRGGIVSMGSFKKEAVKMNISNMIFMSSINKWVDRVSDDCRFIQVKATNAYNCHPVLPGEVEAEEMRAKIIAYAVWASFKAKDLVESFNKTRFEDSNWRLVESLAVPFSMLAVAEKDPEQALTRLLNKYMASINLPGSER